MTHAPHQGTSPKGIGNLAQWAVSALILSSLFIKAGPAGLAYGDGLLAVMAATAILTFNKADFDAPTKRVLKQIAIVVSVWIGVMAVSATINGAPTPSLLQITKTIAGPVYALTTVAFLGRARVALRTSHLARALLLGLAILAITSIVGRAGLRTGGTFQNPIHSATWCAVIAVIVLSLRKPAVATKALAGIATIVTLSLSGSFAVYLSIALLLLVSIARRPGISLWWPFVVVPSATIVALTGAAPNLLQRLDPANRVGESEGSRQIIWHRAWEVSQEHLIIGVGPGEFSAQRYAPMPGFSLGFETHNDYLGALVETGLVGLLTMLAVFFVFYRVGGATTSKILLVMGISAAFHNVINFRHFWIALGLALVLDLKSASVGNAGTANEAALSGSHR